MIWTATESHPDRYVSEIIADNNSFEIVRVASVDKYVLVRIIKLESRKDMYVYKKNIGFVDLSFPGSYIPSHFLLETLEEAKMLAELWEV